MIYLTNQWANIHPFQNVDDLSGYTELIHDLEKKLGKITGLPYLSFQSNSGATGEYSALNCLEPILDEGTLDKRKYMLILIALMEPILLQRIFWI